MQLLIKKYREKKGLSVRALATLTGISKTQLNDIERNIKHVDLPKLAKIAMHLDVCTKALFVNCYDIKCCDFKCRYCCSHRYKSFYKRKE